ncbi:CD151 antigen-like [Aphomia sociella]
MGTIFKPISIILNILYTLIGFALSVVSIWFFIELKEITDLRNSDKYLLNFQVAWPQAIPWIFLTIGISLVAVSLCGYCSACGKKSVIIIYCIFLVMAIVASIIGGSVALIFADDKATDNFISEMVWDGLLETKLHKHKAIAFGNVERKFRCCGANNPGDYTFWMKSFPDSCCDADTTGLCDFNNNLPRERHGCTEVVTHYSRIFIRTLSIASLVSGFIGILNLIVALSLIKNLRRRPKKMRDNHETDTLKLPLRGK